jgi:hypothetical protein
MWFTDEEYESLRAYAQSKRVSMGEVVRDYVKQLPQKSTHGG